VCHKATGKKCGCICGGKFHGASVFADKKSVRYEMASIVLAASFEKEKKQADEDGRQPSFNFSELEEGT